MAMDASNVPLAVDGRRTSFLGIIAAKPRGGTGVRAV